MKQTSSQKFQSECGLATTLVENDMGLGAFHDYLTELKGFVWDKMQQVQKQEEESLAKMREKEIKLVEPKESEVEIV